MAIAAPTAFVQATTATIVADNYSREWFSAGRWCDTYAIRLVEFVRYRSLTTTHSLTPCFCNSAISAAERV